MNEEQKQNELAEQSQQPAQAGGLVEKPAYLQDEDIKVDNSDLQMFAKPPRIKIIQALTGPPFKPPFKEGDVIIAPKGVKVADDEQAFDFTVIHFFPSWSCLNPIQMRGTLPTIRDFSFDPASEVAQKARQFVKERCPENTEYMLKYSESLNFIICIDGVPEFEEVPVHMFFTRGEYGTGQKLIGEMQLRKAPRYACRFRACSGVHKNANANNWIGLDIFNAQKPWIEDVEKFKRYEKLHEELKKMIDSRTLELDLSDPGNEAETDEF